MAVLEQAKLWSGDTAAGDHIPYCPISIVLLQSGGSLSCGSIDSAGTRAYNKNLMNGGRGADGGGFPPGLLLR